MQRRSFLQLLAAVPFVGWMVKPEPSLNDQIEDALSRHEFQPPIKEIDWCLIGFDHFEHQIKVSAYSDGTLRARIGGKPMDWIALRRHSDRFQAFGGSCDGTIAEIAIEYNRDTKEFIVDYMFMHKSTDGLNPISQIGSIVRTENLPKTWLFLDDSFV